MSQNIHVYKHSPSVIKFYVSFIELKCRNCFVQDKIKFGCVRGGSTENFFKNSPNPVYRAAWEKMTSSGILTNNNAEVDIIIQHCN